MGRPEYAGRFSCFGVHQPIRTSSTMDDYYDEIFLSSVLTKIYYVPIMIYKQVKEVYYNGYEILMSYQVESQEWALLQLNEIANSSKIFITESKNKVERIYLRELVKYKWQHNDEEPVQ